ncbi:MAG TPA: Rrf2 family transcriptional regulator [Firmicutes bacterium]|nr:Rrf2 family transcriptional regulator [Bacillota bacterium]HHY99247.1 Rrf2 family transcriptional regulator [Bacillota bacterium]
MEFIKRNTDYALRALAYMAARSNRGVFSISEIAAVEQIPEDFLRKIFQKLTGAGLLVSSRGPRGGFSLARDPREITVREIVEAIQGRIAINRCLLGRDACEHFDKCKLRESWTGIQMAFVNFLEGISLQDLAKQQHNSE